MIPDRTRETIVDVISTYLGVVYAVDVHTFGTYSTSQVRWIQDGMEGFKGFTPSGETLYVSNEEVPDIVFTLFDEYVTPAACQKAVQRGELPLGILHQRTYREHRKLYI